MADLKDRLRRDLTAAMKSRDTQRTSTLRMALAAITNAEVSGKQSRELSDEEVEAVLGSEAKKRREAAEAFDGACRPELAQKERDESQVLAEYLPAPLGADEIVAIVTAAVESTGSAGQGMRAMGQVMGLVQPQAKGRADGGVVAAEVKRQLGA
ncbi:MAG: GatB/YqeY domain-containing protein [Nocardioidaceae bacterium]